jgi:hypothetical protein
MTQGSDQNQDTAERMQAELEELLRQHEQYTLALDAAMDPRTALRLQRTLERLDEEIEGLREALDGYQPPSASIDIPDSGRAVMPEWGDEEEEEPATSIFDGAASDPNRNAFSPGGALAAWQQQQHFEQQQAERDSGGADDQEATIQQVRRNRDGSPTAPAGDPVTTVVSTRGALVEDHLDPPTVAVTPALQQPPVPGAGRLDDIVSDVATPSGGQPVVGPEPLDPAGAASFARIRARKPGFDRAAPGEEPAWGHTEIVPPSYDTQPRPLRPGSRSSNPLDPPTLPTPVSRHNSLDGERASPFDDHPAYDYTSDALRDDEWSLGSRLLLALLVVAFLGGVAWILAQGP